MPSSSAPTATARRSSSCGIRQYPNRPPRWVRCAVTPTLRLRRLCPLVLPQTQFPSLSNRLAQPRPPLSLEPAGLEGLQRMATRPGHCARWNPTTPKIQTPLRALASPSPPFGEAPDSSQDATRMWKKASVRARAPIGGDFSAHSLRSRMSRSATPLR